MSVASTRPLLTRTLAGTARQLPSKAYTAASKCSNPATESTPSDLRPTERNFLDSALRVDQAGEIAANYIYQGQMAVLCRDREVGKLIQVCVQHIYPHFLTREMELGHVGARKEASHRHGPAAIPT